MGEAEAELPVAELAAEALREKRLEIRLGIDGEDFRGAHQLVAAINCKSAWDADPGSRFGSDSLSVQVSDNRVRRSEIGEPRSATERSDHAMAGRGAGAHSSCAPARIVGRNRGIPPRRRGIE